MQDKEFDQLFKDRFEEAEMEPSRDLWSTIEVELAPKRKRVFPVYWMAAAAIVAVIAVGLVFNRPEKIQLQGPVAAVKSTEGQSKQDRTKQDQSAAVQGETSVQEDLAASKVSSSIRSSQSPSIAKEETAVGNIPSSQTNGSVKANIYAQNQSLGIEKDIAGKEVKRNPEKDLGSMQPTEGIARLTTKQGLVKQSVNEPVHQVQPEKLEQVKEAIVIAATEVPSTTKDEVVNENDQADKRGIRNVGDLINYVVDKVDKREDKLIQFKTDDDDNSSLIGINIGMLKFNKKRK